MNINHVNNALSQLLTSLQFKSAIPPYLLIQRLIQHYITSYAMHEYLIYNKFGKIVPNNIEIHYSPKVN